MHFEKTQLPNETAVSLSDIDLNRVFETCWNQNSPVPQKFKENNIRTKPCVIVEASHKVEM